MIVWYSLAAIGTVAVVIALVRPSVRRLALLVGAAAFAVGGVLAILSFGVVFLVAAIACGVFAWKHSPAATIEGPAST